MYFKYLICLISIFLFLLFFVNVVYSDKNKNDHLNDEIIFGVYMYDYNVKKYALESSKSFKDALAEHLNILKNNNVNAVYMSISDQKEFEMILNLFKDLKIKIIPQLNFSYFNNKWSNLDIDIKSKVASSFIKKYKNEKIVIGWSLKEEPSQEDVQKLSKYYKKILNLEPEAKFVLIHNDLVTATNFPEPYPYIEGVDRYGFWWEFSGGGYLASPSFALNWTRDNFAMFHEKISERTQNFMTVVTQGGLTMPNSANKRLKFKELMISEKEKLLTNKIQNFADEGRMGWKKFSTEKGIRYNFWKYYRLPTNCMKALMWSSVMEGSKYLFCWSYKPLSPNEENISFEKAALLENNEVSIWTLAEKKGRLNPQLQEFAEAALEIKKFEKIILNSTKLSNSKIVCKNDNFFNREFKNNSVEGSIFIVHNSNVGTLPDNMNFFDANANIYIDDDGNLLNYMAYKNKINCNIKFNNDSSARLYSMESFQELELINKETQVAIAPGSGTVLFYGSEENFKKLKAVLLK